MNLIGKRLLSTVAATNKTLFLTTPIFYVNAAPHIGHLYSAVITDAIFRFEKLFKNHTNYVFTTGTDEHGLKIQQAAASHKVSPAKYCDKISNLYKELFTDCRVEYTDYVRTTEERHKDAVHAFWNRLMQTDQIYSTNYSGWYCVADETFLTESQMKVNDDGHKVSIESGHPVEWTEEQNYMFKLSQYQDEIVRWIKSGARIKPKKFEKILLDLLQDPLPDVSVSRPISRVFWGIPVPQDPTQSIYVWMEALVNYLTVCGYPNENYTNVWPPNVQCIGKDILKFHGIYWPGFLLAAGIALPEQLFVHSHWTVDGQKMSKSKFNVVDPRERAALYTFDGLRYFLLREGVPHSDGNYSDTKILRILNSELADTLGNLLSRCCAKSLNPKHIRPQLCPENFQTLLQQFDVTQKLVDLVAALPDKCLGHYKSHNFYMAVDCVIEVLHVANNFMETTKPWELKKTNEIEKLETILCITMETLRICGIILQPIIPTMCDKLLAKLNVDVANRKWKDLDNLAWNMDGQRDRELGAGDALLFKRILLDKKSSTRKV